MSGEKDKIWKNNFILKFLKYSCDLSNFSRLLSFNGKIIITEILDSKIQLSVNLGSVLIR